MTYRDESITELTLEQCWSRLDEQEMGRLAYRLVTEVHIVPLNYVVDHGFLLFRTAPGNKLLAAAMHADVAFEIDWYDDHQAWSVVVGGTLRRLGEGEQNRLDVLERRSWLATPGSAAMELTPQRITGRQFILRRAQDGSA